MIFSSSKTSDFLLRPSPKCTVSKAAQASSNPPLQFKMGRGRGGRWLKGSPVMMSVECVHAQAMVLWRMWIQVQHNISFSIKTTDFCITNKILCRENTF